MVRTLENQFSTVRFSVSALPARWSGRGHFFPKGHKVQSDSCQRWKSSHGWDLLPPGGKHYLRTLDPAERNAVEFFQRQILLKCVVLDLILLRSGPIAFFRLGVCLPIVFCLHLFASVFDAVPTAFSHPVICLIAVGLQPGNTIEFRVLALAQPPVDTI